MSGESILKELPDNKRSGALNILDIMSNTAFYGALFVLVWVYSIVNLTPDWDLWARLTVGKIFFNIGTVLKNDVFSYTLTKPVWVDHEWGSGVVFYAASHLFGDLGLIVLKMVLFFITLFLIVKTVQLQNPEKGAHLNILFYAAVIIGAYTGMGATIRCQMFTFLFFTLWIYVLERVRRGETRLLWIIPATAVIWANLHGGFVAGYGLLVIYALGEFLNRKPFKKYLLILIPSVLVSLINPYGVKYLTFILHATTMSRHTITEWLPTNLFGPLGQWRGFKIFLVMVVGALAFSIARNGKDLAKYDFVKYLLVGVTLYLAISHIKHQALFAIAGGCLVYHDFYALFSPLHKFLQDAFSNDRLRLESQLKKLKFAKECFVYFIIFLAGGMLIRFKPLAITVPEVKYPIKSVEFIKINRLDGNLLTVFQWGSYAVWKLYPQNLIAEDGRYEEVYPEAIHNLVFNFNYKVGENWLEMLEKFHTDVIIVEKKNNSYTGMLKNKLWKKIYDDKISAVFVPVNSVKDSYRYPEKDNSTLDREKYNTDIKF